MAATTYVQVDNTQWVQVASGIANVLVQIRGGRAVRLNVGSAAPALGANDYLLISTDGQMSRNASFAGLGASDKVFARADDTSAAVTVVA